MLEGNSKAQSNTRLERTRRERTLFVVAWASSSSVAFGAFEVLIMWVRKSEDEIQDYLDQEEAKKKSLLRPFLFALALTVVTLILYSLGFRGGSLRAGLVIVSNPSSLGLSTLLIGIFLFVCFFAMALYNQRRRSTLFSASDSLLCRECKQPSNANPSVMCQCGGKLEPFACFTWIEDEPNEA